jgi:mono/diheme cytochrome c family protein
MPKAWLIGGAAVAIAIAGALVFLRPTTEPSRHSDVMAPTSLSAAGQSGAKKFASSCASCHGERAAGSDRGPPLIHKIYEPSHHGDRNFLIAVRNGVRQHHWNFGNMPPQPGVSNADVAEIVTYVRALQRANGIN